MKTSILLLVSAVFLQYASGGGGGGISLVCGAYQPFTFASGVVNISDPGCGIIGDDLFSFFVYDATLADPFSETGATELTVSGNFEGCLSTCVVGVFRRTLTGSEAWNGDVSVTPAAGDGLVVGSVVLRGVGAMTDLVGLAASNTTTPTTPAITATGSAFVVYMAAIGRQGHNAVLSSSINPVGTFCPDMDGTGNCSITAGTNKTPVVGFATKSDVVGDVSAETFGALSSVAGGSFGLAMRLTE